MVGDLIGTTVACCMVAAHMPSAAARSMTATRTSMATTAASRLTVEATVRPEVSPLPAVQAPIVLLPEAVHLAELVMAEKPAAILLAEEPALAAVVAASTVEADTEAAEAGANCAALAIANVHLQRMRAERIRRSCYKQVVPKQILVEFSSWLLPALSPPWHFFQI
jgi:hypothetical protein